jgi:hypothetical protein
MKLRALASSITLAAALATAPAAAQYRLRADAFYSAADASSGFIMLSGESRYPSWLDAEAVVWMGTGLAYGNKEYPGDVLIASVRAREPGNHAEIRAGRFLESTGAIRPIHLDGAQAIGRAPWGTSLEIFGGVPVAPEYQPRDYDWTVGGRLAQRIGSYGSVGVSYLQLRQAGAIAYSELGFDASATPVRWLDAAFSGAVDMERPGITDGRVSLALRPFKTLRIEGFAMRRAPSHLLPATSLFAALGDLPSDRAGGTIFWRAAPRLDVLGEAVAESLGGELGGQFLLRTTLRLDDRGDRALALEMRRQGTPGDSWTGVRGTARMPINRYFAASTELEVAMPDEPRHRGAVWPWGLVALRFKPDPQWELASALEASASPTSLAAVTGLFRVSRAWGAR